MARDHSGVTALPPVFVGGVGAQGHHVGRLIGRHTEYVHIPVAARFHALPRGLPGLLRGRVEPAELCARIRTEWWHGDCDGIQGGLDRLVEPDRLEGALQRFEDMAPADPVTAGRQLVRAIFEPVADLAAKRGWVETTQATAISAHALHRMFPDMRLVHCLCDGRRVVASTSPTSADFDEGLNLWAEKLRRISRALDLVPQSSVMVLQLEDLGGPERSSVLRRLLGFLQLEEEPGIRWFLERRLPAERVFQERWDVGLSPVEKRRVTAHYQDLVVDLVGDGLAWVQPLAPAA